MENELMYRILDKLDSMDADIKSEISGIKDRISGIEGEISDIKDRISGIEGEISGIKTELVKQGEQLASVNNRLTVLEDKSDMHFKALHDGYKLLYEKTDIIINDISDLKKRSDNHELRLLVLEKNHLKQSV